jgi:hypothetical protein
MKVLVSLLPVLAVLGLAPSAHAQSRLGEVSADKYGVLFATIASGVRHGGNGAVNTDQFVYFDRAKNEYRIESSQFSCGLQTSKVLEVAVYNMDGSIKVPDEHKSVAESAIVPGSVAADEYRISCNIPPLYLVTVASVEAARTIVATQWAKEKAAGGH